MNRKPIVLTFLGVFLPGFKSGGPVRTVANMAAHLRDDVQFRVVTSDRDALDRAPYPGIRVDEWNRVAGVDVLYLSPSNRTISSYARIFRETAHDIVYLNSFFNPRFTSRPLIARKLSGARKSELVIAPRGEFSPGALAIKPAKKRAYIRAVRASRLYRDAVWHASSEYEAMDIRRIMGPVNIHVAPNLAPPPSEIQSQASIEEVRQPGDPLRIVFLSRITPKKNLDFALRVLANVKCKVEFDIIGPVRDEGYWQECNRQISSLPSNVTAAYRGTIEHSAVDRTLSGYDLFFLPTLGENYGHVIAEALDAGTPVLIADTTPWRHLSKAGAGWDLPLSSEKAFVEIIEHCASLHSDAFIQLRQGARAFARKRLSDPAIVAANRDLFATKLI